MPFHKIYAEFGKPYLFKLYNTTDPQSKQDRIPYKQSRPHQSCRQALSPTVILV